MCASSPIAGHSRSASQCPDLDLLRAIAVLLALLGHFIEYSGFHNPVFEKWKSDTDELAHFAVLMFFIHTSLVLMMSLDRLRRSVTDA
jgi:peptidoglycan/LPS O-acetylase OafA/YrhL